MMKADGTYTVAHPTLTVAKLACASVGMTHARAESAIVQLLKEE